MLNLKIHFLQTAGGGLMVKSAFLGDFGIFLYANLHNVSFFRSVSDHGRCGVILKLLTVGVHSCVVW